MKQIQSTFQTFIKNAAAFCIIVFVAVTVKGQQPVFKNYNVKDGLPSTETYYFFQDSKGFIWVASDAGVARFDGYSFKAYGIENGLADNTIFSMSEDRHGRIWFRSLSGKLSYFENDSICSIGANDSIVAHIKNTLMISFYVDSADTLWCGIRGEDGYYKIYPGYKASDFHCITPNKSSLYLIKIEGDNFINGNVTSLHLKEGLSVYQKNQFLGSPCY